MIGTNLITVVIIVIIRIIILGFFAYVLFNQWNKSEMHSFKDLKFLYFLQFLFQMMGKIFDLYLYITIRSFSSLYKQPELFWIVKMRYFLAIGVIIPTFMLLIFIWFINRIKLQIVMNTAFIVGSILLILLAPNYSFLTMTLAIMAFPLTLLTVITFYSIYRSRRLPQFNSRLMYISYILLFIAQTLRPLSTSITAGEYMVWISELIEGIIWLMMGLAFFTKPSFSKNKSKKKRFRIMKYAPAKSRKSYNI